MILGSSDPFSSRRGTPEVGVQGRGDKVHLVVALREM